MEQIILSAIRHYIEDSQGSRPRQHGFMKDKSFLMNLISFYDKMTQLMAVNIIHLNFHKVFHTVSLGIVMKLVLMAWMNIYSAG